MLATLEMRPLLGLACAVLLAVTLACDAETAAPSPTGSTTHIPSPTASLAVDTASPIATLAASPSDDLTLATVTRVVDGDTIHVDIDGQDYPVRYIGVDTPETVDPERPVGCFGPEASAHNKELVDGQSVGLEKDVSETDRYGRLLRYVWLLGADGQPAEMVNAALVRDGYAQVVTYPPDVQYQDTFLQLQREAREAGRGLWGAVCATPALPPASSGSQSGVCEYSGTSEPVIKGNISPNTGEKIYHVPGQQYYDETVIDEGKGERWFCTEAEAVAAGWRKSKV